MGKTDCELTRVQIKRILQYCEIEPKEKEEKWKGRNYPENLVRLILAAETSLKDLCIAYLSDKSREAEVRQGYQAMMVLHCICKYRVDGIHELPTKIKSQKNLMENICPLYRLLWEFGVFWFDSCPFAHEYQNRSWLFLEALVNEKFALDAIDPRCRVTRPASQRLLDEIARLLQKKTGTRTKKLAIEIDKKLRKIRRVRGY